jgi:dipeptidyl aminopeptidase/acylaminoacyl peptidase
MTKTAISMALAAMTAMGMGSAAAEAVDPAGLAPNRPGHAILAGPPVRPLTEPKSVISEKHDKALPIPIDDALFLRSSWFAAWAPDSLHFVMSSDLTGRTNLWKVAIDGGFPQQLQQSEDKTMFPAASPDGTTVVYASDQGGREIFDVYALSASGGAPVNLTKSGDATETGPFVFSKDSHTVAFERRPVTGPSFEIAVMDVTGKNLRVISNEKTPGIYWSPVAFSADGKSLIANRSDLTRSTVWEIDVASGVRKRIAGTDDGFDAAHGVSPDGKLVSVTSQDSNGLQKAILLNLETGKQSPMLKSDWPQEGGAISPDGETVVVIENTNGRDTVFLYDIAKGLASRLELPSGHSSDYFGLVPSFSPDGKKLLFPVSSGSTPFDYWTYDLSHKTSQRVTNLGLATISADQLPKSQLVNYKSYDGTVIGAILWVPYNLQRDGTAPVVVLAHGGPTGQTYDTFDATATALASRGYLVIAPNVRGSTGYGRAFEEGNRQDLGGRDLEDEAAGADFLVASGYADQKKIGITGGSYGGFMTVMAVARMPGFWAAGVEEYGIVNWRSMWERGSPALREYQRGLIGDPAVNTDVYDRTSPLTYLKQTKAPLLVLQGDTDLRVPRGEAEQIVQVLKAKGNTVDSKIYPEEGHGFMKRENQIDALDRTVKWFDLYLKGKAGSDVQSH